MNLLAEKRGTDWFRRKCIVKVPLGYPGFGRDVYPGFLQLSGFMAMNMDRHVTAHWDMFQHLVRGDGDSAEKHREFYDEYLAVMDLPAEYFLQTVDTVFVNHRLPKGEMMHRGEPVDLSRSGAVPSWLLKARRMTSPGSARPMRRSTSRPTCHPARRCTTSRKGVGHYGVFNGTRFRAEIAPASPVYPNSRSSCGPLRSS